MEDSYSHGMLMNLRGSMLKDYLSKPAEILELVFRLNFLSPSLIRYYKPLPYVVRSYVRVTPGNERRFTALRQVPNALSVYCDAITRAKKCSQAQSRKAAEHNHGANCNRNRTAIRWMEDCQNRTYHCS